MDKYQAKHWQVDIIQRWGTEYGKSIIGQYCRHYSLSVCDYFPILIVACLRMFSALFGIVFSVASASLVAFNAILAWNVFGEFDAFLTLVALMQYDLPLITDIMLVVMTLWGSLALFLCSIFLIAVVALLLIGVGVEAGGWIHERVSAHVPRRPNKPAGTITVMYRAFKDKICIPVEFDQVKDSKED